jgi:hypothetical protein
VTNGSRRDYPRNAPEFDGWLKANAVVGSIVAIAILAMAVGGLFSAGRPDAATEFSSVTIKRTPHTDLDRSAARSLTAPPRLHSSSYSASAAETADDSTGRR